MCFSAPPWASPWWRPGHPPPAALVRLAADRCLPRHPLPLHSGCGRDRDALLHGAECDRSRGGGGRHADRAGIRPPHSRHRHAADRLGLHRLCVRRPLDAGRAVPPRLRLPPRPLSRFSATTACSARSCRCRPPSLSCSSPSPPSLPPPRPAAIRPANSPPVLSGWARGGQAKVAVVSSFMFGTVSGSSVANVVASGTFTIPMMKRAGYDKETAGGGGGGGLHRRAACPPVMGAGAFIMAEVLGVPYTDIALAAVDPRGLVLLRRLYAWRPARAAEKGCAACRARSCRR